MVTDDMKDSLSIFEILPLEEIKSTDIHTFIRFCFWERGLNGGMYSSDETGEYLKRLFMHKYNMTWCLCEENRIVGVICTKRIDDKVTEIEELYLYEKYRWCGLEEYMLKKVIKEAYEIGISKIIIDYAHHYEESIKTFKDAGFKLTNNQKYFPFPESILILDL